MRKSASHRKALHFHFDQMQELPTQELQQVSISEKIMKRQNQILQSERHQAIVKKSKKDQQQGLGHVQSHQQRQDITVLGSSIIEGKKEAYKISEEEQQLFEQQALKLLTEFLLHPNRNNRGIINSEIANEWILRQQTSTKLKSYLILYMILYRFEEMEFKFTKRHGVDGQKYHKELLIERKARIVVDGDLVKSPYEEFKQNQLRKYLSEYLEWLIEKNREMFEIWQGNVEFWAMAMNRAEELALQLIKGKSLRQKSRNFFLSNFLINAECPLYCSTIDRPRHEKIIFAMKKEDLESLPLCHWILGVNFSVKYFFKKPLFQRIKQSINPNNIDKSEIQQFYHEYQLLCRYFDQSLPLNNELCKQNLGDLLLQWMTSQSVNSFKKTQAVTIELSKIICEKLLQKALNVSKSNLFQTQSLISTTLELLQRQNTLSLEKKDYLISQILYRKNGVAVKLGKDYPLIIQRIQQTKCAQIPELFQIMNNKYSNLYRHLMLSQQQSIKNDFLAQFKHLTQIEISLQKKEIKQRINCILTSFNLITHWNNSVLKTFVYLIQKYLQKLQNSIIEKVEKHHQLQKQAKEINSLLIFLKIHLRLQPFNFTNLKSLCQFIQQGLSISLKLRFEQKTLNFMKKDLLSRLFTRNQLNESLLSDIKKNSKQQPNLQNQQKKIIVLDKLTQFSRGINYFENQIQLLRKQASLMPI